MGTWLLESKSLSTNNLMSKVYAKCCARACVYILESTAFNRFSKVLGNLVLVSQTLRPYLLFSRAEVGFRASHLLGKCSTTELYPSPFYFIIITIITTAIIIGVLGMAARTGLYNSILPDLSFFIDFLLRQGLIKLPMLASNL